MQQVTEGWPGWPWCRDGASARFCLGLQKVGCPPWLCLQLLEEDLFLEVVALACGGQKAGAKCGWNREGLFILFSNTGDRAEALVCNQPSLCLRCPARKGCGWQRHSRPKLFGT